MAKKKSKRDGKAGARSDAKTTAAKPPSDASAKQEHVAAIGAAKSAKATSAVAKSAKKPAKGTLAEPDSRSFWYGYEVAWAKLLVARFVIFGLLAVDALLQISHAPRYGAGGFNVAHLPGMDSLGPGRVGFAIAQLLVAYLLVFAALGVRTRIVLPIATALYGWLYFGSQLDSYQHHYLVFLVLLLSCFVPWARPADATPATPVRAWAIRLVLVQLGIMYVWAAVSKMDAAWLDGRTLDLQIHGAMRSIIDDTIGIKAASRFALIIELILALTVWWKRTWFIALPLGVAFHAGILASGLEIGLFAVLMLGFYILVVPDRVFVWVGEQVAHLADPLRGVRDVLGGWVAGAIAIAISAALAFLVRLPHAMAAGLALAGAAAVLLAMQRDRSAAAHGRAQLFAIVVWLIADRASSTAVDYYRFWGGNARRLGDPQSSEYAYRKLVEIDPEEPTGHYQLGRILLGRGEDTAGLLELHEAQRLEPGRARAFVAEAQWLSSKGRTEEAIAKAKEATYAEPNHPSAQQLVDSLTGAPKPDGTAPKPDGTAPKPNGTAPPLDGTAPDDGKDDN